MWQRTLTDLGATPEPIWEIYRLFGGSNRPHILSGLVLHGSQQYFKTSFHQLPTPSTCTALLPLSYHRNLLLITILGKC